MARRSFLAGIGKGVGVLGAAAVGSSATIADTSPPGEGDAVWRPASHEQDDWFDKIPGVHRFVFDVTTPAGVGLALRFANNYYNTSQNAYGLKYGKQFSAQSEFTDPKTKQQPHREFLC